MKATIRLTISLETKLEGSEIYGSVLNFTEKYQFTRNLGK
jgi:hypothetical protein